MNIIARLLFELASFDIVVHHVIHYDTGTASRSCQIKSRRLYPITVCTNHMIHPSTNLYPIIIATIHIVGQRLGTNSRSLLLHMEIKIVSGNIFFTIFSFLSLSMCTAPFYFNFNFLFIRPLLSYLPDPSARAGYDTRSIF